MTALDKIRYALREYPYVPLGVTPEQVMEVVRFGDHEGPEYSGEYDMAAVCLLADGTYAAIEGGTGCETGWSCQASLHLDICASPEVAWERITRDGRGMIERAETRTALRVVRS
jgi:hypothetical protein